MMRHSVVLVAMLCVAGAAWAQQQAPSSSDAHADWQARHQQSEQQWQQERAKMQERRLDRLAVLLDMTPAQKQQVQTILSAERTRVQQAMKQAMEARRAAHTETVTKLGQVLSPAQMKKLKVLMPQRHRHFMMGRGGMGMHGMHGPMDMHGSMDMDMHGPMAMHGPKGMWDHHPDHGTAPPPPPGQ